jgi:hypothetical protein
MINIDILNDKKYSVYQQQFRNQSIQHYPATEIALIERYLNGEKTLIPDKDFSIDNLELIKKLLEV